MSSQPPLTDDQTLVDSNFAAEVFWEKNQKAIIGAVVAVVVVAIGIAAWFINAANQQAAAAAMFAEAKNPESWREVIAKYPKTLPAANAYFLVAESQREQGNLDESNKTYQTFIDTFPKHPLIGGARLGLAENLTLQGKFNEALDSLRQIQSQADSSYAGSYAGLLEGQTLIREGKLAEARKVLLSTAQNDQSSPAGRIAGSMGDQLAVLLPAEPKPAAAAPLPTEAK